MTWITHRLRSLQFRFAVILTTVLLVCAGLSVLGLSLNRQLVATVRSAHEIATRLEDRAEYETRLRWLGIRMSALAHETRDGGAPPDARWHEMERVVSAQLDRSIGEVRDDPSLAGIGEDDMRAAERNFVRVTLAMLHEGRRHPETLHPAMRRFHAALDVLEQRRDVVRHRLQHALGGRMRETATLARRLLVQMALAGAVMLILGSALIVWLRWRVMRPLMRIVAAVRAMNAGGTLPPLPSARRVDELGELSRALQALSHAGEERERAQRQVEYLAHHDSLTGLANRVVFAERLNAALLSGRRVALLAIDLDGFKGVNDTLGHAMGDAMLKRASTLLSAAVRDGDVVARIGGDEFAIIHHLAPGEEDATALSQRIYAIVAADPETPAIRMSIGIALSRRHGVEGDELHACADIALYRAKADGRHRARHYDAAMDEERRQLHWLAHELRGAGQRGELRLAFQPIADCASRRIIGQEALARWTHPVLGPVSPDIFIALAEEHGLIAEIGQRLLVEALTVARHWPSDWMLAINLSPVQLRDAQMAEQMLATIADHGADPHRIEVEVTEGVLLDHREIATANLRKLRAAGVRIVMDDFGTGYSSLSSLQQFPFDKIKIDRSFISAMASHGPALSIVRASIGLGRSLNIPIVAEGVETDAQHAMLRDLGCQQIQGYLIGRPGTFDAQQAA